MKFFTYPPGFGLGDYHLDPDVAKRRAEKDAREDVRQAILASCVVVPPPRLYVEVETNDTG